MKSTKRLKTYHRHSVLRWCWRSLSSYSSCSLVMSLAFNLSLVLLLVQIVQVHGVREKYHLDFDRSKLSQFQKSKFHIQQQQNQQNYLRKHEPEEKRSESEFVKGKSEYFLIIRQGFVQKHPLEILLRTFCFWKRIQ